VIHIAVTHLLEAAASATSFGLFWLSFWLQEQEAPDLAAKQAAATAAR